MLRSALAWLASAMLGAIAATPALADATYTSKTIAEIQPPQVGHDCIYFRLDGVAQADPAVPNGPYFAMPRTHIGFKEIYPLLLAAYLNGTPVSVRTSGAAVGGECGSWVGVQWVVTP